MLDYSTGKHNIHEIDETHDWIENKYPQVTNVKKLDNGRSRVHYKLGRFTYQQDVLPDDDGHLRLDLS
jgi:hypothetical protein